MRFGAFSGFCIPFQIGVQKSYKKNTKHTEGQGSGLWRTGEGPLLKEYDLNAPRATQEAANGLVVIVQASKELLFANRPHGVSPPPPRAARTTQGVGLRFKLTWYFQRYFSNGQPMHDLHQAKMRSLNHG